MSPTPAMPRLKIAHQLSLLLAGAALLAVLAMSAVVWWNLREGFAGGRLQEEQVCRGLGRGFAE